MRKANGTEDREPGLPDVFRLLQSIDESLKRLVSRQAVLAGNREDQAILLIARLGPNVRAIAEAIGVSKSTAYAMPRLAAAIKQHRLATAGASARRGIVRDGSGELGEWHEDDRDD